MRIPKLLLSLLFFTAVGAKAQNVGINGDASTPDNSAMLDVKSTSKGMLVPRMTAAQKNTISSPATGLLVFQTDSAYGFYFNAGAPSAPNWTLLGASGATGAGFANGTAAAQIYLTGTAPFAPQAPVTMSGDVTIATTGVTTIANNVVDSTNIVTASIPISKIRTYSGTAGTTTFLRGDGTWGTPASSSGGAKVALSATSTGQTIPAGGSSVADVSLSFSSYPTPSTGSFNGTTFTVADSGVYMITAHTMVPTTGTLNIRPSVYVNGSPVVYGTTTPGSTNWPVGSANAGMVTYSNFFTAGTTISIYGNNINSATSATLSSNGTTRLVIVKL